MPKSGSSTDQLKSYIEGLKEAAELAQSEADNWKAGNIAREKAMAIVKAENIAKKEGKTLSDEQRAAIERYAEQTTTAKKKVEDLKRAQDDLNSAMREFADMAVSALDNLIVRGQKAGEVLRSLLQTLASSALKGLLTGEGTFGKLFGLQGSNGSIGGVFSSIISAIPKYATGGQIGAGKWGIAGEAGPELIQGPATVTPFGKSSGGAKVTVHNYAGANVSARQMSDGEILVLVQSAIASNNKKVPGLVADAQRRSM